MVKEQPCTGIPQAHCRFGSRNGNKVEYSNKASCNLFDSKESCLQFVNNNATSVKHNKAQHTETRYAYIRNGKDTVVLQGI